MVEGKRPVFGNRLLEDPTQVYKHNAWDNVEWDVDQEQLALGKVAENSASKVTPDERVKYEEEAAGFWHSFYQQHQNRFFKDRHWLFTEFPELKGSGQTDSTRFSVFEVGCGAGNTVFPILQTNSDPHLFVYCCDFAESAVKIVKSHDLYDPHRCHAFQYDIGSHDQPLPFPPGSLDLVILIFVLSALQPEKFQSVLNLLSQCLKPGGMILFRDYGRYDMAQLRFKKGRCLSDNFYVRGDGTRVYFFTEDEVNSLFSSAGLQQEQLYTDRRLQVNRGRQVKMYRVWIQAKYRKPKHLVASGTLTTGGDTGSVASGTPTTGGDTGSVASGTLTTGGDTGSVASGTLTTGGDTGSVASGTLTTGGDTGSVASGTLTTGGDTGSVASGTPTTGGDTGTGV